MNYFKNLFLFLVVMVSMLVPQQVVAQSQTQTQECVELRAIIDRAGGAGVIGSLPAYCSVGALYTKFLNFALYAVGIAAVLAVIYGGYLYMTAGANEMQRKKGSTVLTWAIIGLVVVVVAAVIVNIVIRAIVENRFV